MKKTFLIIIIVLIMIPTFVNAETYDFSSYQVRKEYNEI